MIKIIIFSILLNQLEQINRWDRVPDRWDDHPPRFPRDPISNSRDMPRLEEWEIRDILERRERRDPRY